MWLLSYIFVQCICYTAKGFLAFYIVTFSHFLGTSTELSNQNMLSQYESDYFQDQNSFYLCCHDFSQLWLWQPEGSWLMMVPFVTGHSHPHCLHLN